MSDLARVAHVVAMMGISPSSKQSVQRLPSKALSISPRIKHNEVGDVKILATSYGVQWISFLPAASQLKLKSVDTTTWAVIATSPSKSSLRRRDAK